TLRCTRSNAVCPPEAFKDVRKVCRGYSHAGVTHREHHVAILLAQLHLHFPAPRRVLDGIRHEVRNSWRSRTRSPITVTGAASSNSTSMPDASPSINAVS